MARDVGLMNRAQLTWTMPGTRTLAMKPRLMCPWMMAHASTAPDCASGHTASAPQPYPTHANLLMPAHGPNPCRMPSCQSSTLSDAPSP